MEGQLEVIVTAQALPMGTVSMWLPHIIWRGLEEVAKDKLPTDVSAHWRQRRKTGARASSALTVADATVVKHGPLPKRTEDGDEAVELLNPKRTALSGSFQQLQKHKDIPQVGETSSCSGKTNRIAEVR